MKVILLACIFILAFSHSESSAVLAKDLSKPAFDTLTDETHTALVSLAHSSALRVKRSMKEDIEKGFKEFSDKVSKLPDQLSGSIKKYFEEKGISMDSIQKILNDIWEAVQKLIDEVKKAM